MCLLGKIIRQIGSWAMGAEVSTVSDRTLCSAYEEAVRAGYAMVYVNGLDLEGAKVKRITGPECLELDARQIVFESGLAHSTGSLENQPCRLATVHRDVSV